MKPSEEWADSMCEPCPCKLGYKYRYLCPFCLPKAFAAAQKDALESAAKVAEDEHCGPIGDEVAAAIRALITEGK